MGVKTIFRYATKIANLLIKITQPIFLILAQSKLVLKDHNKVIL